MQLPALIIIIFGISIASGCAGTMFTYEGSTASEENRIALAEGGPHVGSWRTLDLSMNYRYRLEDNRLAISGTVQLDNSLKFNFTSLDFLFVRINFINSDGLILESHMLLNAGRKKRIRTMSFEREYELAPQVTGMAFSYEGNARESGGGTDRDGANAGGSDTWHFWRFP